MQVVSLKVPLSPNRAHKLCSLDSSWTVYLKLDPASPEPGCYIGGSDVTDVNGFPVSKSQPATLLQHMDYSLLYGYSTVAGGAICILAWK